MGSQDCECSRFVNESRVLSAGAAAAQEEPRRELLQMSEAQLEDVARVCNRYPDIHLSYQLEGGASVPAGEQVTLTAQMEREIEGDLRPADAPRCAAAGLMLCPVVNASSSACKQNCLCVMRAHQPCVREGQFQLHHGAQDRGRPPACGRPQVCSCVPVVSASLSVSKHTDSSAIYADQPCIRESWPQLQHAQHASLAQPSARAAL